MHVMELEDNRLLAFAGPALERIADAFEAVPLRQGQPIHEPMEPITHDFLALMLGVRRSSVTNALHIVEGSGAIKATRSLITVRDRDALQLLAGASYGLPEREYRRVLG